MAWVTRLGHTVTAAPVAAQTLCVRPADCKVWAGAGSLRLGWSDVNLLAAAHLFQILLL